ncbi:MAG: hydantoinase B/oxoprolinase family protein [Actinomycetia bacterium]|nr:hydantoinase B/oxoprolinase family protein [Actinomycetes bacterium]
MINGNCRNTPVEVFETRHPWGVQALTLVQDSGEAGRHRGGLGLERIFEALVDGITISEFADRTETEPWGLFGGTSGMSGSTLVRQPGDDRFRTTRELFGTASNTKFSGIRLNCGDQVLLRSGGGYRDPRERPRELVDDDVAEGFVGHEAAQELYGRGNLTERE